MKKKDVEIGGRYVAKVSGKLTTIQITRENRYGGWHAKNTETGRAVRIRTAARLRRRVPGEFCLSITSSRSDTDELD